MGRLIYGPAQTQVAIEDRALAHLKVVIINKLRRSESFLYSWELAPRDGGGRSSIWLDKSIPLAFEFETSTRPDLNRAWLYLLSQSANSATGLRLTEEPPDQLGDAEAAPSPVAATG